MIGNPYQQYQATVVKTASPVELVTMLYQGVLRFTLRGIQGIEQGNVAQAHEGLTRAQAIVIELAAHLDMEAGGEIAKNLNALYLYSHERLVEANCKKAVGPAEEVVRLFRELLPAWQQLAEGRREELAAVGAGAAGRMAG
jgi:flagellar secretion chaperone FliS